MLLLNLLLALAWMALTGAFDPLNFAVGFVLGYLMLRLVQRSDDPKNYFQRAALVIRFVFFYLKELLIANIRVAGTVLSPKMSMTPAVVAIPLEAESELSIALLANLITLTPGSLTLDISADCSVMYIHTMYADDIDQFRLSIKDLERRVLEVTQ
jgi:multicomponent Na+:H+ antiporter subunit E